jgi:phosphatidylglycerophosphate synthase
VTGTGKVAAGRTVRTITREEVRATYKARDSWWTVLLVDPVAGGLVRLLARHTWLTPTRLTIVAFLLGLAAAAAFVAAGPAWLVAGAVLYHLSFTVDCVDGKIARLRGEGTMVGSWLDFLLDRVRVVLCAAALFSGQFLATGEVAFLVTALAVVFLSLFGYVNGAEMDKARQRIAAGRPAPPAAEPDGGGALPGPLPGPLPAALVRLRGALHRRRVRMNVVSGIEFEMALFVLAPLLAAGLGGRVVIGVAAVAGGLLVAFELALIARFWLAARAFDRRTRPLPMPAQRAAPETGEDSPLGR